MYGIIPSQGALGLRKLARCSEIRSLISKSKWRTTRNDAPHVEVVSYPWFAFAVLDDLQVQPKKRLASFGKESTSDVQNP